MELQTGDNVNCPCCATRGRKLALHQPRTGLAAMDAEPLSSFAVFCFSGVALSDVVEECLAGVVFGSLCRTTCVQDRKPALCKLNNHHSHIDPASATLVNPRSCQSPAHDPHASPARIQKAATRATGPATGRLTSAQAASPRSKTMCAPPAVATAIELGGTSATLSRYPCL
ncbi:uncharacterized protein BKA78DRAFT_96802 [Phyllosticta capitalensis]|uniref:uncharacterized protein n=1 Tax=Phyllosticta capitalensis TaxID=121624 RepID=UPI003130FF00